MQKNRQKILEKLLQNAVFDGWNDDILAKSAKDAGLDEKYAYIAFPDGISSAVAYYIEQCDAEMLTKLEALKLGDMKIRQRITQAILTRLEIYDRNKEAVAKLMPYFAHPQNAPSAASHLINTVSQMWYAAGDKSADFNYYTKRATLAAVYSSSLLYWINDDSQDYSKTKSFIDKRIENVMGFQKIRSKIEKLLA